MEKGRSKVLNFFQQINNEKINENQKRLKNQLINATKAQEPLELILKDYFESTHCFGINYGNEIVNGIPIPEMFLSFRIFNEGLTDLQNSDKERSLGTENGIKSNDNMAEESCRLTVGADEFKFTSNGPQNKLLRREKQRNQYWFLKLLATEEALKPLCSHPYITAFLDLHYSTVEKARSQMNESVPHLALTLLFLVLVSTMPGQLQHSYGNVLWLAIFPCALVLLVDIISLCSFYIDSKLHESLVKDILPTGRQFCDKIANYFANFAHFLGYAISVTALAFGYLVSRPEENNDPEDCEENSTDANLRFAMELMLLVYPMFLMGVEIIQMKSAGWNNYIKSDKNRLELVQIVFAFIIAVVSMSHKNICHYPWMPNLIWIVILLSFIKLIYDLVECLPNNDHIHAHHYLYMFIRVSIRYLTIIVCFAPFLIAFAACFKAMANDETEDDEFAPNLYGAFVRTIVWFVGEVENNDMWISKRKKDGNIVHLKIEDWMAKFILLVFIFSFTVVLMNFMNAVAIVDIQELKKDVIGIRNKKKIKEILHQRPEIPDEYSSQIRTDPVPQSNNWIFGLFIEKGYFCQAVLAEKTRKNFLPEATFVALKECSLPPTFRYRSQAASLAGTIYENHKYSAQIINTNTVDEGAVQS